METFQPKVIRGEVLQMKIRLAISKHVFRRSQPLDQIFQGGLKILKIVIISFSPPFPLSLSSFTSSLSLSTQSF